MWFLDGIEFAERELSVEEDTDKRFVSLTLVLTKPLTMNLTVQLITTSHSATGESCINYCTTWAMVVWHCSTIKLHIWKSCRMFKGAVWCLHAKPYIDYVILLHHDLYVQVGTKNDGDWISDWIPVRWLWSQWSEQWSNTEHLIVLRTICSIKITDVESEIGSGDGPTHSIKFSLRYVKTLRLYSIHLYTFEHG